MKVSETGGVTHVTVEVVRFSYQSLVLSHIVNPHEAMVPSKPTIFALRKSLLRQARLLPHEYLRYFLAVFPPPCSYVTFGRQFFRLKLTADIKSALDESRKEKPRRATFKRLRKVISLVLGPRAASNVSAGTLQAYPR